MNRKPDDAAKIAGLANILKTANQQKEMPPAPAPAQAPRAVGAVATAAVQPARGRVGKRDHPDYHQCGLYIRKTVHKQARRRLEDTRPDMDMSELVEELLEQWLASKR